ncbi:P-type ATPase [Gracilaria domingensis]|nr:P-type ATPase [Gracilaria domingensis]
MLVFEATVVAARLRSLRELRGMRNPPLPTLVYRGRKWQTRSSLELLPGDIISIGRGKDPSHAVPCDLMLLSGSAVVNEAMLTGESVPLMKEPISTISSSDMGEQLAINTVHKNHILFGGTRILTYTPATVDDLTPSSKSPDNGCICFVLRTGFGSSQGKLMRTILYSTESVTENSWEAAMFILLMLVFAIAASAYVLHHRYTEDHDGRYKLLLRCVLIITSVVPPELPMQLAIAVNNSLIALAKSLVFCTEPYRIPYAGKIDICCFDKTGTLTTDSINAAGVALPSEDTSEVPENVSNVYDLLPVESSSIDAALVLGACHSLVHIDNELVGDPLELAALESVNWVYGRSGASVPKRGGAGLACAKILQRYRFASALQRMSVIADVSGSAPRAGLRVLLKGSPEAVGRLLEGGTLPEKYKASAHRLAREGYRVLALAYKDLEEGMTASQATKIPREEAESDLKFAGFVCFECPLRTDSRKVIRILKKSSHMVTMITGDATLTAAHVATQVGMCSRSVLILDMSEVNPDTLEWFSANSGKRKKRFAVSTTQQLSQDFDLCISGPALRFLLATESEASTMLKYIRVYARMSPEQKETILTSLKEQGLVTLMCGDGTNDVGALKQAHVGVALLSAAVTRPESAQRRADADARSQVIKTSTQPKSQRHSNLKQRKKHTKMSVPQEDNDPGDKSNPRQPKVNAKMTKADLYQKKVDELTASLGSSDDQAPLVKLGDASIASPFTSRRMTIESCASIIRQGRCTLATTLQMYQILALNCLISAYSLSVLYLEGVVLGDKQMTIMGVVLSVVSFMINRSKPLKKLSAERPASSIFSPHLFFSTMGQFVVHVICMIACMHFVRPYLPEEHAPTLDEDFAPSLPNTVIFLLSIAQQLSVYVLNYKGRPFMQSLSENKALLNALFICAGLLTICTAEVSLELNEFMELVPWPSRQLQMQIFGVLLFDLIGALLIDKIFTFLLAPRVRVVE